MADDRNYRGNRPDPYGRGAPSAGQGAGQDVDPLTELARLIGQSDPFAIDPARVPPRDPRGAEPAGREPTRREPWQEPAGREPTWPEPTGREPTWHEPPDADRPLPPRGGAPTVDPYRTSEGMFPQSGGHMDSPLGHGNPRYGDTSDSGYGEPQGYGEPGYYDPRYGSPSQPARDPYFPADRPLPTDGRGYDQTGLGAYDQEQPGLPDPYYDPDDPQHYDRGNPQHGHDERRDGRHGDETYDEVPVRRRSRSLVAAIAIFGLAVVGTAGAFAYRAVFSGSPSGPAPVIRADNTPNKVVPVQSGGDTSNKQIYDRIIDKSQNERVVSREEQPVEIRDATRPPAPRMVVPTTAGPGSASTGATGAPPVMAQPPQTAAAFAPASVPSAPAQEPKKIRTVTIRPDQANGSQASGARSGGAAARQLPMTNAQASGGPLSLTPDGVTSPRPAPSAAAAPQASSRVAAVAPPAAAPPAASAGGSGGYVVQVLAQNSEGEAQSSFRAMQAKYPSQLGGRSPLIRRKDTPAGVRYGAQVGPFSAREEAVQLCEGLKAAGGSCFVQRN
jgi:hypothetical protein